MAEYIDRKSLIDEFDRLGLGEHSFVERVFSDGVRTIIAGIPAADVAPVVHGKRLLADMSGAKAVSLHDIYRVIAGHSYYHGDSILAALTCIVEGKEVNPVRPADVAPVVYCCHCRSYNKPRLGWCSFHMDRENYDDFCSYGVRMDGDAE